jgi:peptidoglycan/LPS O-acetylase OafA/YrhL
MLHGAGTIDFVILLIAFASQYGDFQPGRIYCEVFFVQNYCTGFVGGTWSLAVEEHFYLLFTLDAPASSRALT